MTMGERQTNLDFFCWQHEVDGSNQILKDENSRLREQNTELRAEVDKVQRELQSFSVTRDEMEAAVAVCTINTLFLNIICYT